ncbi:hypothetical protein GCM10009785_01670 [Brooklawnia cerclae]|uniref:Uncharacterized protein n=1 Tax=Brooklawnia cerclae TaxID=349934 RepID=A0ABX0SCW0_9ACTN|nr:hypothetical protein [Brooklawnia cerclae]NIH56239.1 hypothetical protein [Brooklawnia cerclae]
MKRVNLRPSPEQQDRQLGQRLSQAVMSGTTVPTGVKDLGASGDVTWTKPGEGGEPGTSKSVRESTEQLEQAAVDVAETMAEVRQAVDVDLPAAIDEAAASIVTGQRLADGAVTADKIAAGAVSGDKIADWSVAVTKFAASRTDHYLY